MIKARGRILQTGFTCVNAFTVLFTVQAASVSAERGCSSISRESVQAAAVSAERAILISKWE